MDPNMSLGDRLRRDNMRNDGIVPPGKLDKYYGPESCQPANTGPDFSGPASWPKQQSSSGLASGQGIPASPYTQPPQQLYASPPTTSPQPSLWQPVSQHNSYSSTSGGQASPPATSSTSSGCGFQSAYFNPSQHPAPQQPPQGTTQSMYGQAPQAQCQQPSAPPAQQPNSPYGYGQYPPPPQPYFAQPPQQTYSQYHNGGQAPQPQRQQPSAPPAQQPNSPYGYGQYTPPTPPQPQPYFAQPPQRTYSQYNGAQSSPPQGSASWY